MALGSKREPQDLLGIRLVLGFIIRALLHLLQPNFASYNVLVLPRANQLLLKSTCLCFYSIAIPSMILPCATLFPL